MQTTAAGFDSLSDEQLLAEIETLVARERQAAAAVIASLAELDARQLYLAQGCSSLFSYCTDRLHFSEDAAYDRMKVARAVRQYPRMLDLLTDGSLTLTAARLLAPHLTESNHDAVLRAAAHKRIREVEEQIALLRPKPDLPPSVRKLPERKVPTAVAAATIPIQSDCSPPPDQSVLRSKRPIVSALAPERYGVQFTISRETRDKLRRVQDLLRHAVPDGNPATIFDRALTVFLADLEKKKAAQVRRPRAPHAHNPCSRYIPASVRRDVWARDGARCAFIGSEGRCTATGFLEFHHVVPYADGGLTVASNRQLRCRAHNAYEASVHFAVRSVGDGAPACGAAEA